MCFNDLLTPLDRSKRSALRPLNLSRITLSRTCQGFRIRWTASSCSSTNQWWRNTHWRWSYSPWMNAWRPPLKWWTGKEHYHKENLKTEFLKSHFFCQSIFVLVKKFTYTQIWMSYGMNTVQLLKIIRYHMPWKLKVSCKEKRIIYEDTFHLIIFKTTCGKR